MAQISSDIDSTDNKQDPVFLANLRDILKDILSSVNEWLRFAETKNGALLALNSGCAIGISKLITDLDQGLIFWGLGMSLALFLGSATVCLVSFLPTTTMPLVVGTNNNGRDENLLFFGSIANHNIDSYLQAILHSTPSCPSPPSQLERLYAEQIIINSGIAKAKYKYFKFAMWLCLAAVCTIPIALVLYLVFPQR